MKPHPARGAPAVLRIAPVVEAADVVGHGGEAHHLQVNRAVLRLHPGADLLGPDEHAVDVGDAVDARRVVGEPLRAGAVGVEDEGHALRPLCAPCPAGGVPGPGARESEEVEGARIGRLQVQQRERQVADAVDGVVPVAFVRPTSMPLPRRGAGRACPASVAAAVAVAGVAGEPGVLGEVDDRAGRSARRSAPAPAGQDSALRPAAPARRAAPSSKSGVRPRRRRTGGVQRAMPIGMG